ncbi:MAG: hypothetical protein ACKOEJ_05970, partial [Acidimicrobiaceae bacterium]
HPHKHPRPRKHPRQLRNPRLRLRPSLSLRLRQLLNLRLHLRPSLDQPRRLQLQRERRSRQMFRTNFYHQLCVVLLPITASM